MTRRRPDGPEVHRITDARRSRTDDMNRRINRYLMSMSIRTVCVVLIFVLPNPWRWLAAAGAIFLPWIAVIFANASDQRGTGGAPGVVDHRGLSAGSDQATSPDPSSVVLEGEVVAGPAPAGADTPSGASGASAGTADSAAEPPTGAATGSGEQPAHPAA